MNQDNWHRKMLNSTALPIGEVGEEQFADQNDCLYILELFQLNFKQSPIGAVVLHLSFFNFSNRRFCGSLKQIPCDCSSSVITLNCNFHFRAISSHKNVFLVLELETKDGASICWTAMPAFEMSRISADLMPSLDDHQLRQSFPLFAGSCRTLLFADSLSQLMPHLQRLNAVLLASLRLSSARPAFSLPEFLLFLGSAPAKFIDKTDQQPPHTFTSILDNLTLSYGAHSDLSDAIILDLISREQCYGRNQSQPKVPHQLRVMERRLKIGTHNGLGFVEEPFTVLLHSSTAPASSTIGRSFRQRSQSLGRRDGPMFGSSEFYSWISVRLRRLNATDPSTAIVFVLEYLIASLAASNAFWDILLDARMVRVGWAAWTPSSRGTVSLADTVTLQLLGGPRPSPFDGFCLRDLSHSAFVGYSPNVRRDFSSPFPIYCAKIEIRFNFVPLMECDHLGRLSLLSSHQQTPLPRPDFRPRSSAGTHQVEVEDGPVPLFEDGPVPLFEDGPVPLFEDGPVPLFEDGPVPLSPNTLALHNSNFKEADELLAPEKEKDETITRSRTTAGAKSSLVSVLENKQNAIEVELPHARVSAFPRHVARHFTQFPFPTLTELAQFTRIDPMEKREIRKELERIDKFGASEVSFQFMGFRRLGSVRSIPSSHQLFFSFQFFSFESVTTESLFLDAESAATDEEVPMVLCRNGGGGKNPPGLIVRFIVSTHKKEFLRYLLEENVCISIWEADSLFYVGSISMPLKCLLRQGSAAVLCSVQAPVLQNAFPPSTVGRNGLVGLLYFRMANVGKKLAKAQIGRHSLIHYGEKAQSLRKSADGMNPLERFLAFQRMDMEQRSMRIFGEEEQRRVREWAQLRGGAEHPLGQVASDMATKFLFSEELATYRALRREGKALALLRTVFSSVTTSLRAEAFGGQLVHLLFQLRNPFPEDCICAMEVNDPRLSPVTSKEEMEFVRQKHQQRHIGRCLFEWEKGTNGWTTLLGGMERVEIALQFDTGTAEHEWALSNAETRAFFRRLPQGDPLAILEVAVSVSRPFLSHHFQWFADEGRKLVRLVPISRAPVPKALSVRVSDPSMFCSLQPCHFFADGISRLRIECLSRGLSDVRHFLVFVYSDLFHSELFVVHRVSVHSLGRLHSVAVQGQQIRIQLGEVGHPPAPGELVRLFCSTSEPSACVDFLPSSSFAASPLSFSQMSVHFRPSLLGLCHLLIGAVATSTCTVLAQWLLTITVDEPNIGKVFEVNVPRASEGIVRKRIPLHNPLNIPRQFRLVSSDLLLLSLPTPLLPPVPPNSSIPLPLIIQCPQISRPCTVQALLFVEDVQTGAQEETFAVRVQFE